MKKILLPFTFLMCLNLFAQDLIIKNDQTEVKSKVIELTDDTIKYKKYDMLDGPIYSIKNSEVFMIVYKNGTKEYISQKTNPTTISNPEVPITNLTNNQKVGNNIDLNSSKAGIVTKQSNENPFKNKYPLNSYITQRANRATGNVSISYTIHPSEVTLVDFGLEFPLFDSFYIGGGLNIGYVDYDAYDGIDWYTASRDIFGFNLSANYKIPLGDNFHVWPGITYSIPEEGPSAAAWLFGANWYFHKFKYGGILGLTCTTYEAKSTSIGLVFRI